MEGDNGKVPQYTRYTLSCCHISIDSQSVQVYDLGVNKECEAWLNYQAIRIGFRLACCITYRHPDLEIRNHDSANGNRGNE